MNVRVVVGTKDYHGVPERGVRPRAVYTCTACGRSKVDRRCKVEPSAEIRSAHTDAPWRSQ